MKDTSGWIKIHRKITEWEWYENANVRLVFFHFLLIANHEDKKWKGTTIKRGEFIRSLRKLSEEIGVSVRTLRTCITKLKSTQEVTQLNNNNYTHISINNYNCYQSIDKVADIQLTQYRHSTDNKQELKNEKNIRNRDGISENDLQEIANKYQVSLSFVYSKWDDLQTYCQSHGRRYKDYRAALRAWVKKDAPTIRPISRIEQILGKE